MAKFDIAGDTSGVITVQGPAIAGSNTLTWPAETGTAILSTSTTALPGQIAWNTTVQTTGFTAVAYGGYFCNTTSAAFTVTLPLSPTRGQFVVVVDYAGTAATNNITVSGNGANIKGQSGNAILSTNRQGITFTYIDATQGWVASSNVYGGNPPFVQPYTASYLVVAGGGNGGGAGNAYYKSGGGGAGGLLSGTATFNVGTVYTATVGAGGSSGANGSNSTLSGSGLSTITSTGGGYGGGNTSPTNNGGSGGSGGGSFSSSFTSNVTYPGGSGTPGQGFAGGTAYLTANTTQSFNSGGGGGGAGGVGGDGVNNTTGPGGAGGNGVASSITGSSVTYAGGGGGAGYSTGGLGGPGTPGVSGGNGGSGGTGTVGVVNTGGGGGGAAGPGTNSNGGSGVVILSVPTANYSGTTTGSPTITTSGSNTIIKWTTAGSGTYTA